jgi:YHS domain-containing protein
MGKKIFFIVGTIALLLGCSEIHQRSGDPTCRTLFDKIQAEWNYNQADKTFFSHDRELGIGLLRDKSCLVGFSERSVIKLFGEPSMKRGGIFYYFLSKTCHGDQDISSNGCSHIDIKFSDKNCCVLSLEMGSTSSMH